MEKKLANEMKIKEQLQMQNEKMQKLIQVHYSDLGRVIKVKCIQLILGYCTYVTRNCKDQNSAT